MCIGFYSTPMAIYSVFVQCYIESFWSSLSKQCFTCIIITHQLHVNMEDWSGAKA